MLSGPPPPPSSTLDAPHSTRLVFAFVFLFFSSFKIEYVHHLSPGDSKHNCPSCISSQT